MISQFENTNGELKKHERLCSFYASDYHFEMIILPYIKKEINKNHNVIILTENDLKDTVQKVLKNVNLCEKDKNKIFALDWCVNDLRKLDIIRKNISENTETTVFIKGGKNYIKKMNSYIQENADSEKIKPIDCYYIDDVQDDISNIIGDYSGVINTIGKIKID